MFSGLRLPLLVLVSFSVSAPVLSFAHGILSLRETTVPAPIVISPSQYWEGNDGPWSTFTIQVGTPAQDVRVLISTSSSYTTVVLPEGCLADGPSNCAELRGGEFNINASSTWHFKNYYDLELESNLGYSGAGEFGFDRVGIDWQGSGGPILDHQVVGGIALQDFWLGEFGLTPRPTNFTDFNEPHPSFIQTLKSHSMVPSLSWSYTAGAHYRLEEVFGSLIFGGFDASKAGSPNMTFGFAPDISRDLTIGLQSITVFMADNTTGKQLLPEGIFTFIDSTVPHIWLPLQACQEFESALGLTWNDTSEFYLVDEALHDKLVVQKPSFTFQVGNATDSGDQSSISITLPYESFDFYVDYPIVENRTRYFPLKRAANDSQYTLGRTFLQEAYLTVDYERSQFILSQCLFEAGSTERIIAIPSINSTSTAGISNKSLSTGAIAGIAVGAVLAVLTFIAVIAYFLIIKHRRSKAQPVESAVDFPTDKKDGDYGKAELDASCNALPGHEIGGRAVEFYKPDEDVTLVGSPLTPPPPHESHVPVYEMTGEGINLPELPTSSRHEVASGDQTTH